MAALTASQAPGAAPVRAAEPARQAAPAEHGPSVSGDTPYRTELPPLRTTKAKQGAPVAGATLPASVFAAYRRAEAALARTAPGCRLRWQLLAAIGQVESGQARGGRVTADGTTVTPILGPRLDGRGFARIRDTDGGAYDGDAVYDRAVGPMQFIPSTWARWGADGNGDGRADPGNIHDAALAAGRYLCAGWGHLPLGRSREWGRDLSDPADLDRAILGYNRSAAYLRTVRAWYAYFLSGHRVLPDRPAQTPTRPEPSRPGTPKPATPRPSGRPDPGPSRTPATPSPSPSPAPTRTADTPVAPDGPLLPLPSTGVKVPGTDPLTSNSADTMSPTPSPTAATGR
ncbi:lytic transglycosylase domain-containing protein [Streptomyces sp. TRM68367]|nr:lytic transglycosylase domain-containing protein [Streptomyces sp. TRM68367]